MIGYTHTTTGVGERRRGPSLWQAQDADHAPHCEPAIPPDFNIGRVQLFRCDADCQSVCQTCDSFDTLQVVQRQR